MTYLVKHAPWGWRPIRPTDLKPHPPPAHNYTHVITDKDDRAMFLCMNEETAKASAEYRNIEATKEIICGPQAASTY